METTPPELAEFRRKLFCITKNSLGEQQPARIAQLNHEHPHCIRPLHTRTGSDTTSLYNCHAFAFDLLCPPRVGDLIRSGNDAFFPRQDFVWHLIHNHLREVQPHEIPQDWDYVVYFRNAEIPHSGKLLRAKVISKWGQQGHLWEHGRWEVPEDHGEGIQFYRNVAPIVCAEAFRDFVEHKRSGR